jgi:hypothetical protein
MAVTVYVSLRKGSAPTVQNINCSQAVAWRQMVAGLRRNVLYRGTEGKRGEFSCTPVDVEASMAKYESIANKGASPDKTRDKALKPVIRDISPAEVRKREAFWQSGVEVGPQRNRGYRFDGLFANNHKLEEALGFDGLMAGPAPSRKGEAGRMFCSFCQREVDPSTATVSKSTKKVACEQHCLEIHDPKFWETEG